MKHKPYPLTDLHVRKHVVICEILSVPSKTESIIIQPNKEEKKEEYLDEYVDHVLQAKVLLVGPGMEEFFPKGIKKGDIVYMATAPSSSDAVNINGEVYIRVFASNITMVRTPKSNINSININ